MTDLDKIAAAIRDPAGRQRRGAAAVTESAGLWLGLRRQEAKVL